MLEACLEWFGWIAVRRSSFASFCFSSSEALGDRSSLSLSGFPSVSSLEQEGSDWHERVRPLL